MFQESSAKYEQWLDGLTEGQLADTFQSPFGLPLVPVSEALKFPVMHTESLIPQIEYIQTILGDRVWR